MEQSILYLLLPACLVLGLAMSASAQASAHEVRGQAAVVPLASEPPAKLVVDPPLPEPLALGRVVIQYRTENLHIVPVYGPAALDVSPRIGHLHLTVDDAPWHWLDASNEPITLNGFPPGPHRLLIELADPTHKIIGRQTVNFVVPAKKGADAAKP
ncbi:DUF6130 family protein [Hymenobacter terricola]|uniref:DUF6130 family protein n=1 Tax=Hymenobacter terricola TaxID=2819236 RepID=UPI001CF15357|nr:DUF6130 family protein [Hymenobacter terricola]